MLVDESEAGVVDAKTQKTFDKSLAGALEHIAKARAEIADAKAAVDEP